MSSRTSSAERRYAWAVGCVVLVGAALRLSGLGEWDMWTDEVQTLWMSASGEFWFGPMYSTAPVNFWLTGWAVDLLGADEIGLRAIPALSGILTVVALYPLARKWVSERAALLGTAVLAFSFWHVAWSQTGRHFALQTLLILGAVHGFLAYWREGRRSGIFLAGGFLLVSLFTHSSSGFYVVALLLVVSVTAVRRLASSGDFAGGLRSLWPRPAVAGLVLLGVLFVYLPIYLGVGSYVLENRSAWNPPWNILGSLGFYVTPVVAAFAAGGVFFLWRRQREVALTLLSIVVLPVILLSVAAGITIASAAYCLPSLVGVAVLAGAGCDGLLQATSGRRATLVGAGVVVAGLFAAQGEDLVEYYFFQNGLKPRWTEATAFVEERREPGESVWAAEGDVAQYYLGSDGVHWMGEYSEGDREERSEDRGVWFILYLQFGPDFEAMMAPSLRARDFPPGARFEALFPVRYGPKDRTLVVLHRPGTRTAEPGMVGRARYGDESVTPLRDLSIEPLGDLSVDP